MATCDHCGQEMLNGVGCTTTLVTVDVHPRERIRYGEGEWARDLDPKVRCHDCGAPWGTLHHPGCDMEECPRCHGQLISCGCIDDDGEY